MPILNGSAHKEGAQGQSIPAPDGLRSAGPIIPVKLAFSDDVERAAKNRGRKIVQISGTALIDTGANRTCFDVSTAKKLGLPITDSATMTSATHDKVEVPVYEGRLITDGFITINCEQALGANLEKQRLIALIGRDVLERACFIYNGPEGNWTLAI